MSFLSNINPVRLAQAVVNPVGAVAGAALDQATAPAALPAAALVQEIKLPIGALPPARAGGDADVADARRAAEALWHPAGPQANPGGGRIVDERGAAIEAPNEARDRDAVMEVFRNRELEKQALARLTPEQQAQYAAAANMFEHDPQAHLALQVLLLEGKLGSKTVDGKQDLLGALDQMRKTEMEPPLTSGQLMAEAVREIADPSRIQQKNAETCAVASLQVQVATEKPAEYVRILAGLGAKGDKGVELADHSTARRQPGLDQPDAFGGRTATSRLWQSAFMAYGAAHSPNLTGYDARTDEVTLVGGAKGRGLDADGTKAVRDAVFGDNLAKVDLNKGERDAFQNLAPGDQVELGSYYKPDGTVDGTSAYTVVARNGGNVTLSGPGGNETIPMAEFQARVQTVKRPNVATPAFDREDVKNKMYAELKDDVGKHQSVPVSIRWGELRQSSGSVYGDQGQRDQRHVITVTEIKDGRVYYLNSQGTKESMDEATFKNRMEFTLTQGPRVS